MSKIVATIEARMTSSRLPGKVLLPVEGKPVLLHIVERLKRSRYIDDVVVATTINETDDAIEVMCRENGCSFYRGSEEDVLLRVLEAAKSVKADTIVEITGDCPVIDWRVADDLIAFYDAGEYDYCSNMGKRPYPVGFETQVFSVDVLQRVSELTTNKADREHVSLYIYTHPEIFKIGYREADERFYHPEVEVTLDDKNDYELVKAIYDELYRKDVDFSALDVIDLFKKRPDLYDYVKKADRKYHEDFLKEQKSYEQTEQ